MSRIRFGCICLYSLIAIIRFRSKLKQQWLLHSVNGTLSEYAMRAPDYVRPGMWKGIFSAYPDLISVFLPSSILHNKLKHKKDSLVFLKVQPPTVPTNIFPNPSRLRRENVESQVISIFHKRDLTSLSHIIAERMSSDNSSLFYFLHWLVAYTDI